MDERLVAQDGKLNEVSDGLNKTRVEISHQVSELTKRFNSRWDGLEGRMDKLGSNFDELKQLLQNPQGEVMQLLGWEHHLLAHPEPDLYLLQRYLLFPKIFITLHIMLVPFLRLIVLLLFTLLLFHHP